MQIAQHKHMPIAFAMLKVMAADLQKLATTWQREADALLAECGLPQVLERVGTVQYTGSSTMYCLALK